MNKAALNSMGFHTVYQVTSDVKYSNQNVMEYLRRIVPRMFQVIHLNIIIGSEDD